MESQALQVTQSDPNEPQAPRADVVETFRVVRPSDAQSQDMPGSVHPRRPGLVDPASSPKSAASALPPTSTLVRARSPHVRAWKIDGGRIVIDHAAENIRHVLQDGIELSGEIIFSDGGLAFGGRHRRGVIRLENGTLIVLEGAIIEGDIDALNLYNLGTISSANVRANGLLVNWGSLKGESIEYGALENYGEIEGALSKIRG